MSSLDEFTAMPATDAPGVGAPEQVLAAVKAEGARRRARRHRRNVLVGLAVLVLVVVPALAVLPEDGSDRVTVASDTRESSTTEPVASTTASTAPTGTTLPGPVAPVDDTPATTPGRSVTTTVPASACRNSTDPACGPFRWDPPPGPNQPLGAAFVDVPEEVVAGAEVTFVVQWSDPDADLTWSWSSVDDTVLGSPCTVTARYGPWTPPAPSPGAGTQTFRHTFPAPGTYVVRVQLATSSCGEPYASETGISLTVTAVEGSPPGG